MHVGDSRTLHELDTYASRPVCLQNYVAQIGLNHFLCAIQFQ